MPLIHAEVIGAAEEYLEEWADAMGCEVHDVAGVAIEHYLSDTDKIDTIENRVTGSAKED